MKIRPLEESATARIRSLKEDDSPTTRIEVYSLALDYPESDYPEDDYPDDEEPSVTR